MPQFAANLSFLFCEWPFLDRFQAAADVGFRAVEFLFPYDHSPDEIGRRLRAHGLTLALFNLPPGDWRGGERGLAALPERFGDLREGVERALFYAAETGVTRLHLLAGLADRRNAVAVEAYRRAVSWTAERLWREDITLLIEPINGRDIPGYFLGDFYYAEALIADLALPNLKLQFDIYHRQILHGDVTTALARMMPIIGHIQVAGVPDRGEPSSGELNDGFVFREIDRLGYDGFIGCEYRPRAGTLEGLGWLRDIQGGFDAGKASG